MSEDHKDLNFTRLDLTQLMRDGEEPIRSVVATHPNRNEMVSIALGQLTEALLLHMDQEQIIFLEEEAIQMTNTGRVLELSPVVLFFSLSYPTVPGRTFELQFGAPPGAAVH